MVLMHVGGPWQPQLLEAAKPYACQSLQDREMKSPTRSRNCMQGESSPQCGSARQGAPPIRIVSPASPGNNTPIRRFIELDNDPRRDMI